MSTIPESITLLSNMLAGVMVAGPRSAARQALERARSAVCIADLACGGWKPQREHHAIDLAESIEAALPAGHTLPLTDLQWEAGTAERSTISDNVYRVRAGGREWIVRLYTEGGYGEDGTGTRELCDILAHGEASS